MAMYTSSISSVFHTDIIENRILSRKDLLRYLVGVEEFQQSNLDYLWANGPLTMSKNDWIRVLTTEYDIKSKIFRKYKLKRILQ